MNNVWLFLDFDNTLMGTEQFAVPSLIERFNILYGSKIDTLLTFDYFKQHFHGQAREILCKNLSQHFNIAVDYPTLYESREWRIMQYLQQLPTKVPMAPKLIEVLTELKNKGMNLALVSNNPIQRALAAMRYAENGQGETLATLFGTCFFEADTIQKPHPQVYLRAMAQVEANPKTSFAVEDSITGTKAAVAAGLTTFGFTGFADNPEEQAVKLMDHGCVATFNHWDEFKVLGGPTRSRPL